LESGDFGLKVLAVDLDPQSHLTLCFIDTPPKVEGLSRHVLNVQCAPGGTGGAAPHGAEHLIVTG